jgi:hydroxymethylglutaryl-CoA lyase
MNAVGAVKIVEVGPRDGLQNEKKFVETKIKIDLINRLSKTGLKDIEVGSFVSAKAIPQLSDSHAVFLAMLRDATINYSALVPNVKGLLCALNAKADQIAVFASCSETFSQKNINCSIEESFLRFDAVIKQAKEHQLPVRGYLSCVLKCPYEGSISPSIVTRLAERMLALGVNEISLGDTIGIGTPMSTQALLKVLLNAVPKHRVAMHFHDTYGLALTNIYAALEHGIRSFDSSVAGLGGCPYAKGASGNVASEDVVYFIEQLGFTTGVDLHRLIEVGNFISEKLNRENLSKVAKALTRKNR